MAHQQLIGKTVPQFGKGKADIRLAHAKAPRGRIHSAFFQQNIKHDEQVEVKAAIIHPHIRNTDDLHKNKQSDGYWQSRLHIPRPTGEKTWLRAPSSKMSGTWRVSRET